MNIEVPTKYQLSHNNRIVVFENRVHSENPMFCRPALHGNWNALSLTRRALKDKFPTPTVPLTAVLPNRQVFRPDPIFPVTPPHTIILKIDDGSLKGKSISSSLAVYSILIVAHIRNCEAEETPSLLVHQPLQLSKENSNSNKSPTRCNSFPVYYPDVCQSQWPCGLKRRSAAAHLLRSWVRIPPEAWMFVCCECRVLSGRGLCDELITRPEESYRLWCVIVCELETSRMRRPWPALGRSATAKKKWLLSRPVIFISIKNWSEAQLSWNV